MIRGVWGYFLSIFLWLCSAEAFAQESVNDIASNVIGSAQDLPGLIAAIAYGLGILAGVLGVLKLKDHVENPAQKPLNEAVIRLAVAGALFALPIIYEAALNTFDPNALPKTVALQADLDDVGNLPGGGAGGGNTEVNDLARNAIEATNQLPGLIAGLAYLLGVLLGVLGILKFKESVDIGSNQAGQATAALRAGVIRLLAAGALFALPIIYEALDVTISGGTNTLDFDNDAIMNDVSNLFGSLAAIVPTMNLNNILANIIDAIDKLPTLIAAVAYLLGLMITVAGILKIRDHVESPEQTPLKDGVIRLIVAGALFALPSVYNAMFTTVGGDGLGILGNVTSVFAGISFFFSGYGQNICTPGAGVLGALGIGTVTTGELLCDIILHTGFIPAFLSAIAYLIGLVFGLWGIFKIRDHVLNPQQTGIWEGVSRFIAGGLFFALPIIVEVARNTFVPGALMPFSAAPVTGYNVTGDPGGGGLGGALGGLLGALGGLFGGGGGACGAGLDGMLACFMADIMGPLHVVLNFFSFVAGMILLMVGTSRLIKSAQDGARGPGGLGTIMTFAVGAALISYNEIVRAFSTTFTGSATTNTYAYMEYTDGMSGDEVVAAHIVITSIIQFMILVGLISFVRGLFIVRSVAEGNQQASIMAGMTHLIGGALAINLGPLMNAVQGSLGIADFGISFS